MHYLRYIGLMLPCCNMVSATTTRSTELAKSLQSPVALATNTVETESKSRIFSYAAPKDEKKKYKVYRHLKKSMDRKIANNLGDQVFEFSYSGDVNGVLELLKQYDSSLVLLKSLGERKSFLINLDLSGVKIQDIADSISNQTNNQVNLIYSITDDSLRLNYTGGLDVGKDAVDESLKWQTGSIPRPVLKQDGMVRFPYGEYQPVVTCQPLNLCDLELQAGEEIEGVVIGDSMRWNDGDQGIPIVYSGSNDKLIPHLVLKPSQGGLETSLMVTTSKRTYMLKLKSASNGYVARVGFYYPAEMVQKFNANKRMLQGNSLDNNSSGATNPDVKMPLIDLSKISYNYTIGSGDYSWRPTQVFNDGTSVYIKLPDGVRSKNLPGLCILVDGDDTKTKCEMVNFRYNDHFYIVDKLFNKAKLINGYGNYMQEITISQNSDKKSFWSTLF